MRADGARYLSRAPSAAAMKAAQANHMDIDMEEWMGRNVARNWGEVAQGLWMGEATTSDTDGACAMEVGCINKTRSPVVAYA